MTKEELKLKLPMPELMKRLGYDNPVNKVSKCPWHKDKRPSFSVFQKEGAWYYKCHSGCSGRLSTGDEWSMIERHFVCSRKDAFRKYEDMAR